MSTTPQSLKDAKRVLHDGAAAAGYTAIMSIRAARSARGFHAGRAEIYGPNGQGDRDYSVKAARNKAGLTNASSAMDVTMRGADARQHQRDLTAYLVAEAAAGRADLFEVIGPDANGAAGYWGVLTNWANKPEWADNSHTWHTHISFWRDTEFTDRAAIFRGFFAGKAPARPWRATHTYRLSAPAALRESPQVEAPAVTWAASGSVIQAEDGRSGGPYEVPGPGGGWLSHLWLEVIALDGHPLETSLWTAELLWASLPATPPAP